jgi:glutamine amidotransferase
VPLYRFLIGGDNSFAFQSLEHPDGWGIAHHDGVEPQLVKSVLPAITDEVFEQLAFSVKAPTVLAHIRRATTGRVAARNCHPFRRGQWVFAHNGQIANYDQVKGELLARVAPELRATLEGETDTEACFLLFLTHLGRRVSLDDRDTPPAELARAYAAALADIREIADLPGTAVPSLFTVLVTNGRLMMGVPHGKPLSVRSSEDTAQIPQVMFSSEAVSTPSIIQERFPWRDLRDDEYLIVDRDLRIESARL